MNLKEIEELIKFVSKSGVSEVELHQKDFKLIIKASRSKDNAAVQVSGMAPATAPFPVALPPVAPVMAPATQQKSEASQPAAPAPVAKENAKHITIKSPMIGTFYRTPSPDKPSFVNVGDEIKPGKVICIIEAMKLFNEIESEVEGRIVKCLVENASPVEYDQPLFLVEPL